LTSRSSVDLPEPEGPTRRRARPARRAARRRQRLEGAVADADPPRRRSCAARSRRSASRASASASSASATTGSAPSSIRSVANCDSPSNTIAPSRPRRPARRA
jgi:hypothetical protein